MDVKVKPNWSGGVKDTFEYLTTIFRSDDGHEQRSAERINARRSVEFEALLKGDRLRDLRGALDARSDRLLNLPEPVSILSTVDGYAPPGAASIIVSGTIPAEFAGRRVFIHNWNWSRGFFAEIASVVGPTVTFAAPIEDEVQSGDTIRACVVGRMPATMRVLYTTDDLAVVPVTFNQNPGERNSLAPFPLYPVFKGREVLVEKPNWSNAPEVEIVGEYETTDFGRGVIRTYSPIDLITRITQLTFTGRKQAKIGSLLAFFHRQMGRLNEFWCPSWTSDLRLVGSIVTGTNRITVAGRVVADYYATSTVDRAIAIRLPNDEWRFIGIASIHADGANSVVTSDVQLNFSVEIGAEIGLYWLNVCRFASDTMTVQWVTDGIGQTVLQIATLEALPAEDE